MKNSLNSSLRSGMLKTAMILLMLGAKAELVDVLKAQNSGKTQTEQGAEIPAAVLVSNFEKWAGVEIPNERVEYTANILKGMDNQERVFFTNFVKENVSTIILKAEDQGIGSLLLLNKVDDARNGVAETKAVGKVFKKQYFIYDAKINKAFNQYIEERTPIARNIINQTRENTAQIRENTAQIRENTAQIRENTAQINKESEEKLLKIYQNDPQNPKLKEIAKEGKQLFEKNGYKVKPETQQMFADLGIR